MHEAYAFNPGGRHDRWFFDPRAALARCAPMGGGGPGRHGRPGPGSGPWGGPGFRGGPHHFGGRRRRMRRGDVRAALLVLLAEQPYNGYGLMQEIERRSDGVWRPSPGSVYPALQLLEDEGLVRVTGEGRKGYELTDECRAHVTANADELGAPWDAVKGDVGEGAWE